MCASGKVVFTLKPSGARRAFDAYSITSFTEILGGEPSTVLILSDGSEIKVMESFDVVMSTLYPDQEEPHDEGAMASKMGEMY